MLNINLLNKPGKQDKDMDKKIILSNVKPEKDFENKKDEFEPNQPNSGVSSKLLIMMAFIIFVITYYYLVLYD